MTDETDDNEQARQTALNPEWDKAGRVHDWRNYVPPPVRTMWGAFTEIQKIEIVNWAENLASCEEWD
jgi:hypothetical protein